MIKIIHLSDIHILNTERHEEYEIQFKKLYEILKIEKPNIIVNAGDTFDLFVNISNEAKILAGSFLNNLTLYCDELIQIIGNHDIMKKNLQRINSIETIVKLIDNPKIKYFDTSGFFIDDLYPITWVNHSHIQKRINPWKISHKKDPKRIYIDLYHDPIFGAKTDSGKIFNDPSIKSIDVFEGDISMLGDIHKYQTFNNDRIIFPGSLIQQDAGENPFGHGVVKWEINSKNDFKHEFIEIENDEFAIIKFNISPGQDYDNLNLITKHLAKNNQFKVDWTEYAPNATHENQNKIRKYLRDKYDAVDIEIKPNRIYSDIKDGKMLSEVIDINDKIVQQQIIRQYLKENKFVDEFIDKIIEIDTIIDDRLQLSSHRNIIWNIDKFWFNNFKGYGNDNFIDWSSTHGIVQISGENQQGKTTLMDAICFILYGKTLSTTKEEKNGNNRFINKYRDIDSCDGGCTIDINGEKYTMYRKVTREFNKKGEIIRCPMTLDYYKGTEMDDKFKQTEENKIQTQNLLDGVLGNFDDFIRMSLTNADNLNSLLSMIKSEFIDGVIRDAGYDIFEKKLEEFKEYKKELKMEKIILDDAKTETDIKRMEDELKEYGESINDIDTELKRIDREISDNADTKEEYLRKLHKIDDDLLNFDLDKISESTEYLIVDLKDNTTKLQRIEEDILGYPTTFDESKLEIYSKNHERFVNERNKKNLELVEVKSKIQTNNNHIDNVDKDIDREKEKYLNELRNNAAIVERTIKKDISDVEMNFLSKKLSIDSDISVLKNQIENIKTEGNKLKLELESYEIILNSEKPICPTCNQPIIDRDDDHVNTLISNCKTKLRELKLKGGEYVSQILEKDKEILKLSEEKDKGIDDKKNKMDSELYVYMSKMQNFKIDYIQDEVDTILNRKNKLISENDELEIKINDNIKFINRANIEIEKVKNKIDELKNEKSKYEFYKDLQRQRDNLKSNTDKTLRLINDNKKLKDNYEKSLDLIKENEKINESIKNNDSLLNLLRSNRDTINNDKLSLSNKITLHKKILSDLEYKLSQYREQVLINEQHDVYLKLVHRSGLPTYLLSKNIDLLNKELSDLLTNTNFVIFFDEDLNLKLQHDGRVGEINVIETSGMERTFSAIVLKIVLRIINFKSKSNIMFFDEIINRLVGKSVGKFLELLETLKTKLDKIIIIEHNNEIMSDSIINVVKDKDGISTFEII